MSEALQRAKELLEAAGYRVLPGADYDQLIAQRDAYLRVGYERAAALLRIQALTQQGRERCPPGCHACYRIDQIVAEVLGP